MLRLSILCLFCLLLDASSAATLGAKVSVTAENSTEAVVSTTESGDLCQQGPMRKGQLIECDAFIPMFTFNPNSGECEGYIYGGCGGSKNLFTTRDECESRCKKDAPRAARSVSSKSACGLPVVEGRCLAAFNRFAYDHEKGDCSEFTYGGCGGNANNFRTMAECLQTCAPDLLRVRNIVLEETPSDSKIVVESN